MRALIGSQEQFYRIWTENRGDKRPEKEKKEQAHGGFRLFLSRLGAEHDVAERSRGHSEGAVHDGRSCTQLYRVCGSCLVIDKKKSFSGLQPQSGTVGKKVLVKIHFGGIDENEKCVTVGHERRH